MSVASAPFARGGHQLLVKRHAGAMWPMPQPVAKRIGYVTAQLVAPPAAASEKDKKKDKKEDAVDVIAHRGSSGIAPENTEAAISAAIKQRADFVEIDVQRTKDGRLVNFHDCTMERTTDVEERFPDRSPYRVSDFTWDELQTLDVALVRLVTWLGWVGRT